MENLIPILVVSLVVVAFVVFFAFVPFRLSWFFKGYKTHRTSSSLKKRDHSHKRIKPKDHAPFRRKFNLDEDDAVYYDDPEL